MSNAVAVKKPAALILMLHRSSLPCAPAPSVAQPLASIWQKVAPLTTLRAPPELVGAAEVGAAVVGAVVVGAAVVGAAVVGALLAAQQMVQPSLVTEPSLRQVKIEPGLTATPLGPLLP